MNRTPEPTGRLLPTATGYDLVLTRSYRAPVEDVWASVTEPERTARWFGTWRGEAAPGRTVEVQMAYEESAPWCTMRIDVCEPPHRLLLATVGEEGDDWLMEVELSETDGTTELRLVHHLATTDAVDSAGPGWEYYLDMLTASRDGAPQPSFDDYFPSQQAYYRALRA
ncbi:SRPBCC family protein [Streptomyces sp. XM4193]|uniref:SRPBCC family protein n=1 Tax=Streptomyces sp. XM4193 TaxID=2929782 RepID=UPI001FFAC59F|nr:SRPBCC family protein [Streptomyces sp. XM4193]MCK1798961.1 SRPBCC family protein [Streptomyces sp. XM4193]